jgi:hypothetical protein
MSNSPSKGTALMAYTRFSLDRSTPSLWRVTFDNPPINLIDPVMAVELDALLPAARRRRADLAVYRTVAAHTLADEIDIRIVAVRRPMPLEIIEELRPIGRQSVRFEVV